jgi:hypothetical protein
MSDSDKPEGIQTDGDMDFLPAAVKALFWDTDADSLQWAQQRADHQ